MKAGTDATTAQQEIFKISVRGFATRKKFLLTDGKFQANCKFKIFIVHKMVGWNKSSYAYLEISLS